jgi:hypothetical protein
MKRHLRRTSVRVVLIVVSAFGAVLWTVDAVWSMQEPKEVAQMSKQMKTVCVGRFLIDVPANARVTVGRATVDGFDIVNYGKESADEFRERVARREEEINAVTNQDGLKNMVSVQDVAHEGVAGKIFVFGRNAGYLFENGVKVVYAHVSIDGFAQVGGRTLRFVADTYQPEDAGNLAILLAKLGPLDADAIPRAPGFCLDGAFLRDPLTSAQGERIGLFAGLPGHDDLGIALTTIAGKTPGPGLLERNAANRSGPYAFLNVMTSTLLEGKRAINGIDGDELAFKARESNFTTGYAFDWETQGVQENVLQPFIALEVQTGMSQRAGGELVQSTLAEASVSELWQRVSSSLRLRPVELAQSETDAELQLGLALGTLAWAGEPCRQSGWWQCTGTDADTGVFGGARQYLDEGVIMPQALLLPRPSVWQKVRGIQPSAEMATPTGWRLADKRRDVRRPAPASLAEPVLAAVDPGRADAAPGQMLRSGDACPASGWWRCTDAQALDATRWFARGVALPPATYLLRRAKQEQWIARQASWQLMRLAPGDAAMS